MSNAVLVRNRQRAHSLNARLLRRIARVLLLDLLRISSFDLGITLVGTAEMTRLNEQFLQHRGSTDVLAFDYTEPGQPGLLYGEIFICVDEAFSQAIRFRTGWQEEVVRYLVHGTLHLCGYDDRTAACRRKMKREEQSLLRELARHFKFSTL